MSLQSRVRACLWALPIPLLALACAGAPRSRAETPAAVPDAAAVALGGFSFVLSGSRELAPGIRWDAFEASRPRRQALHVVTVAAGSLSAAGAWRAVALVGPDPDGAGPAEAALRDPLEEAVASGALVLVNANGFSFLGAAGMEEPYFPYDEGRPVDIFGHAAEGGVLRSPPQGSMPSLRVDPEGLVSVGSGGGDWQAVSGFGALVQGGRVVPVPGGERHPRTAAGVDAEGGLILLVADGRDPFRGPGLTLEELARVLLDLGCVEALNLDGGGSSALVLRGPDGIARIANKPSDLGFPRFALRPVPVMFAIVPAP